MPPFDIDPTTWATLNRLLDDALDLPPAERGEWLEDLPPEYDALKPRLKQILARASDDPEGPLETIPKLGDAGMDEAPGRVGATLGPYRLSKLLAEGGMGAVWLAERHDGIVQRPVALKLPHGSWARPGLWERMAREREILASLNHPHIARLYDAGLSPDGQPYLALEYIEGRPIDVYVKESGLDIRGRVRLFLQVAGAVAHAHGQLVVHRDIKPSNILVTNDGEVKLLDFGIAKLLESGLAQETELTEVAGRALTLGYASPEQVLGEPIGVASDVYSLSVVLFELLTGSRPYQPASESRGALEEAILNAEPPRPSDVVAAASARNALRGDLDTVILKGLKKKPSERFATVNALADDLERHLSGHPVLARPDAAMYRIGKFVGRHKGGVIAACSTLAALVAATGITAWQMVEARAQRDVAIYQQQRAVASSEFMSLLLEELGPSGEPLTLLELLDRGVELLERQYGTQEPFVPRALYDVSRRYAVLGEVDRQLALLGRAESISRELGDTEMVAMALCATALAEVMTDVSAATVKVDEGQRLLGQIRYPSIDATVVCHRGRALVLEARGEREDALASLLMARQVLEDSPVQSAETWLNLLSELGEHYYKADDTARALVINDDVLEVSERSGRGGTLNHVVYRINRAAVLARAGEIVGAERIQREAIESLAELDRSGRIAQGVKVHLANSLERLARYDEALVELREAETQARAAGNDRWVGITQLQIGKTLARMGRFAEARENLREAEVTLLKNTGGNRRLVSQIALIEAEIVYLERDLEKAGEAIETVLEDMGYPENPGAPGISTALGIAAEIELESGTPPAAANYADARLEAALALARRPDVSADVGQALVQRAKARLLAGDRARATADLRNAQEPLANGLGPSHPETLEAARLLAESSTPAR